MEKTSKSNSITINIASTQYELIKKVALTEFGWILNSDESDENWDICWQDFAVSPKEFANMALGQKINHFPGMYTLARKNNLAQNLNLMQKYFPDEYNFFPETWVVPRDLFDLKNRAKFSILIVKPEASCQGKGIILVTKLEELPERCVVQKYITSPFLIEKLKFDLRLYVLLTGCDPLRIFLHQEGLVRFATEEYVQSRKNLDNQFMHLTNYAINKNNPKFQFGPNASSQGHKRSFSWLLLYLNQNGHDVNTLLEEIRDLVIKTVISGSPRIAHLYRSCHPDDPTNSMCFEILGFDVILDSDLKPWLLEVNHSPSFTTDAEVDCVVKKAVIVDALNLININPQNRNKMNENLKNRVKDRNLLNIKEYKKWKEYQESKWKFQRDLFEQQQTGGFVKIFPNYNQKYKKLLEIANQIWCKFSVSKQNLEEEEPIKVSTKKRLNFPKTKKKLEIWRKKKACSSVNITTVKKEPVIFRALPAPVRIKSKVDAKYKKMLNSTGNFLIPKILNYHGMQAPEENKSFMKWKLIKQNLIEM